MAHVQISQFSVRSYEADSYSHLNNGVYLGWFEQGRLDWLLAKRFSYDGFAEREEWFVVGRTEVDFRTPINVGANIELSTEIEKLGNSSVIFRQRMLTETGALACEAKTIMVFSAHGASIPIPADFRAAASED